MVKKFVYSILAIFILLNVYLSAKLVMQGEVHLTNDIGRDFLLLQELDQKKIVLIGARANTMGVFHGSLWTYLNYPAYLLGGGNPVTIAWFWVLMGIFSLASVFYVVKKLSGTLPALLAASLLAVDLVPATDRVFGQLAGFYFIPLFLYSIYKYLETKKVKFLAFHLILLGVLINLNIGNGTLFGFLSLVLSLGFLIKQRLWKHLLAYLVFPLSSRLPLRLRRETGLPR